VLVVVGEGAPVVVVGVVVAVVVVVVVVGAGACVGLHRPWEGDMETVQDPGLQAGTECSV
jgi:hypothetical protein